MWQNKNTSAWVQTGGVAPKPLVEFTFAVQTSGANNGKALAYYDMSAVDGYVVRQHVLPCCTAGLAGPGRRSLQLHGVERPPACPVGVEAVRGVHALHYCGSWVAAQQLRSAQQLHCLCCGRRRPRMPCLVLLAGSFACTPTLLRMRCRNRLPCMWRTASCLTR